MTTLTCRELVDFLSDYLAGELPAEAQQEFERHLSLCPDCVCYMQNFRDAVKAAKTACTDSKMPEVPEALVQAILKARQAK